MFAFLHKHWFLVSLALLITSGLVLGTQLPPDFVESWTGWLPPRLKQALSLFPRIATVLVLFLMAFTLDSRQLAASFRSPRPVVWGSLVNYGVIPLLAWPLMWVQRTPDFAIGLMIAASVPCTLAAASVWTRKAGGNDAVSLMVTLATNAACFLAAPFWLGLTTDNGVNLDGREMAVRLLAVVLVPTMIGQLLRQWPQPAAFATRHKTPIGVVAQSMILLVVFFAAFDAGGQFTESRPSPGVGAVSLVWGCCIAVHVLAMLIAFGGGRLLRFSHADLAAVVFAGSQKTLPIGVLLATDPTMFGDPDLLGPGQGVPFAVFPMLMYHASQLFIDTAVADRLAARREKEKGQRQPGNGT